MIYILFFFLFIIFWLLKTTKAVLFWFYLWQLKDYHLARFFDHFRTENGKRLIFNKLIFLKIIFAVLFFFYPIFVSFALFFIYFIESIKALFDTLRKKLKKPVLTKKTILLIFTGIIIEFIFVFSLRNKTIFEIVFSLLIFDIFIPFITSLIVLLFQPLAVLGRNQIVKKAKAKREKFKDLLVIGITGSYGKTSTKEFLYTILVEKFGKEKILKTQKNQNSEVGVSQCILNELTTEHKIFICEMASYNKGGIKLLSEIAKPKMGIITGVNEQHLATFGSMENLLSAEGGKELIESLPDDGTVIFNGENLYCFELYQKVDSLFRKKIKKIICNIKGNFNDSFQSDFWVEDLKVEKEFLKFKILAKKPGVPLQEKYPLRDSAEFKVNLLGVQNVENILLAAACAKELGMSLKEIALACKKIQSRQGAMKLMKTKEGLNIIDSTYSANPNGVIAHLEYLKNWQGRKIIIMPCLIELGSASKDVHRRIGQKISEVCDLAIIATKERFKEIKDSTGEKAIFIENPKMIYKKAKMFLGSINQSEDIILLEGRLPKELINLFYD